MRSDIKSKSFILRGIVFPLIVLLIIAAIVLSTFNSKLSSDSEKRAYRLLADSAKTQSISMTERVEACFEELSIIAATMDWNENIYENESVTDNLKKLLDESSFADIAVSSRGGKLLYQNGISADCSDRSYFKDALKGRRSTQFISKGRMSGGAVFVFALPVRRNDRVVGVIVATRRLADICGEIDKPENGKNQYNFLCYGNGDVISAADRNVFSVKAGKNIDDYFKSKFKAEDIPVGEVRKFTCEGEEYYGIYTPVGLENIYIFSVTTTEYASQLAGIQSRMTLAVTLILFALVFVAAIFIIAILRRRISIVSSYEAQRRKELEQYHIFQSRRSLKRPNVVSTYYLNLSKNECCFCNSKFRDKAVEPKTVDDMCSVAAKELYPCDKEKFESMFSRSALLENFKIGKQNISGDFLFYDNAKRYVWLRLTAELVKNPVTGDEEALIYAENIDDAKRLEQICSKIIAEDFVAMGLIDVASGRVFGIKSISDAHHLKNSDIESGVMYDRVALYSMSKFLTPHDYDFIKDCIVLENIKNQLENSPVFSLKTHLADANVNGGEYFKVSYSYLDGRKESIVVSCEDISDIVASKTDIETGLLNSSGFHDEVERAIHENPGKKFSIYRYNLDGLGNINATYGYEAGNKLLKTIGEYMRLHDSELSFSAHLYADHFVRFCLEGAPSAEEFYKMFLKDFENYDLDYPISMHVGVYDIDEGDCDPQTMLYKTYLALRSVRDNLSVPIAYYKSGLMQEAKMRQQLLSEVKGALKKGEFEVWFQPQFNYTTSALIGAEALVRWRHPKRGLIPPSEFIPLLEQSRQVTFVDKYVIEKSCEYSKHLKNMGVEIPISVNISRMDILSGNIFEAICSAVKKNGIEPKFIKIEITESAYMAETDTLKAAVAKFKEAGFAVELDDFGSGYSSLNILKDLDIDTIKLDMKLTSQVGCGNKKSDDILRSVVKMAQDLNISIIAEGVENKTQAEFLKSINCMNMQGFYFSKPLPPDEFEKLTKTTK